MTKLSTRLSVGRLIAEGFVIMLSILLALGAQAWWEDHTDRATEREYLVALRSELAESRLELDSDLAARDLLARGLGRLIASTDGAVAPTPDTAASVIGLARYSRQFAPVRSVFDDLVSSGRMSVILSDDIRAALLTYGQALDKNALQEEGSRAFVANRLSPFLAERLPLDAVPLGRLIQVRPGELTYQDAGSGARSLTDVELRALVADDVFRNLMIERKEQVDAVLARNREVSGLIDRLHDLVERELVQRWGEAL